MENSSRFFQNKDCEFFPCHKVDNPDEFNCMFCYCPLYLMDEKCGGACKILENGVKDCSNCLQPHGKDSWELITGRLMDCVFNNSKKNTGETQFKSAYPSLEVDTDKLRENVKSVVELAGKYDIELWGVIKGVNGLIGCAKAFEKGGIRTLSSSRLEQIEEAALCGIKLPFALVRVPMITEANEVVRLCEYSLNSERDVLVALNEAAGKINKRHGVILMADVGDLREGIWDDHELVELAKYVEESLENINLLGVGTNVGCYGSVMATKEVLEKLVAKAEKIEAAIGRKLKYISGGATSSIMRLIDGDIPERINHLRIGEGILLARDLEVYYGYDMGFLNQDVFTLKAEIIELKDKPTKPIGPQAVDAFGKKPYYEDRGIRRRAIVGMGKVDYGFSIEEIFPKMEGVHIIGASSDHTILDVEDVKETLKVGDVLEFDVNYGSLVFLTSSDNVKIVYK